MRSAVALMFSTVASSALGLVFWAVAAHIFDTNQLGQASAGVAAITLVAGLSQLGFPTVLTRFLPTAGMATGRFLRTAYLSVGAASFCLAVLFVISGLGRAFIRGGVLWPLAFCLCVVFMTYSTLQDVVLTGLRRTTWVPIENVSIAAVRIVLLLVMTGVATTVPVLTAWAIPMAIAVFVLGAAIFGPLVRTQHRASRGGYRLPKRKELASFMAAQYLTGLIGNLGFTLPPVLISWKLGAGENAVFYIPWIIGTAFGALLWNLTTSFIVESMADASDTRRHLRHSMRLGAAMSIGGGLALVLLAPQFLSIVGHDYAAGGAASLRWIGLSLPFSAFNTIYVTSLLMERKPWSLFRLEIACNGLFLVTSVFVLHPYGVTGVAAVYALTQIGTSIVLTPTTLKSITRLSERTVDDDVTQVLDLAALRAGLGFDMPDINPHDDRPTIKMPKIDAPLADDSAFLRRHATTDEPEEPAEDPASAAPEADMPTQVIDRVVDVDATQVMSAIVEDRHEPEPPRRVSPVWQPLVSPSADVTAHLILSDQVTDSERNR